VAERNYRPPTLETDAIAAFALAIVLALYFGAVILRAIF
jgi:hypothetical protein